MKAQNFTFGKEKQRILSQLAQGIDSALQFAHENIKKETPVDTGELIDSYVVSNAGQVGNKVSGKISVDQSSEAAEYAPYVEYGSTDGKPFRYFKNGNRRNGGAPFKVSVGANMFSLTKKELERQINRFF